MYICKIPTLEEMHRKWDYEIARAQKDRENWLQWKQRHIARFLAGKTIPYYGILDGQIICEATACTDPEGVQNAQGLVDADTAYLCAFRTVEAFQGQGWFSRLFRHMTADLASRGFRHVTVGVEPEEARTIAIYRGLGFSRHLKRCQESYPDGTKILVDYYILDLQGAPEAPGSYPIERSTPMELKTISGFVVKAETEGDYYCPICHKVLHIQQGQVIPRCCGKVMEKMD